MENEAEEKLDNYKVQGKENWAKWKLATFWLSHYSLNQYKFKKNKPQSSRRSYETLKNALRQQKLSPNMT